MRHPDILLACDIDQTIAGGVVGVHLAYYNEHLELGLSPEDILYAQQTYKKTFDVPAIQKYRSQPENEQRFQDVRAEIRSSPYIHSNLEPIPDAVEQLNDAASEFPFFGYYTFRPPNLRTTTKNWLRNNGFPKSENVTLSNSMREKLLQLLTYIQETERKVILIDDALRSLLSFSQEIAQVSPTLAPALGNLILVGYGMTETEEDQSLSLEEKQLLGVAYLPAWIQMSSVMLQIEEMLS